MQIILKQDVEKVGYKNDIIDVRPGFANNYLIPQGYAISATESAKKVLAENLKQRAHKDAKILSDATAMAEKIAANTLSIAVKASEGGKIYGSVTASQIAEALAAKGVEIDRRNITVPAVKEIGTYVATVRLHKEVVATINFEVVVEE